MKSRKKRLKKIMNGGRGKKVKSLVSKVLKNLKILIAP